MIGDKIDAELTALHANVTKAIAAVEQIPGELSDDVKKSVRDHVAKIEAAIHAEIDKAHDSLIAQSRSFWDRLEFDLGSLFNHHKSGAIGELKIAPVATPVVDSSKTQTN